MVDLIKPPHQTPTTEVEPEGLTSPNGSRPATGTSLGLFFDRMPDFTTSDVVYGATVATRTFMQALLQHGTMDRYELFSAPGRGATAGEHVRAFFQQGTALPKKVNVHTTPSLLERYNDYGLTVFHDPGAIFLRVFQARNSYSTRLHPITFTHHSISYPSQLNDYFLWLLLADTHPCDSVICTSEAARTAFEKLMAHVRERFNTAWGTQLEYRGRYDVIPLGVDTDQFRPRDKADVRHQLELPQDAFIILWFGRFSLSDKMDLFPLLRAYREVVRNTRGKRLLLVLAGTERNNYADAVYDYAASLGLKDHVRVLPNFASSMRPLLYSAADLFVSPCDNLQETFGITPIEAMASGVPQVVSDWDGYRDTVRHGETGFRVPTYWSRCDRDLSESALILSWEFDHLRMAESVVLDPVAHYRCLEQLVKDDALRERMSQKSRERALALYSWHSVIGRYEALWQELAEVAERSVYVPSRGIDYCHYPFFEAFEGYATRTLPEELPLQLTPEGTRVFRGKEAFPRFPNIADVLDEQLLQRVLIALKVASRLGRGYAYGLLARDLASAEGRHEDCVRRHVLWLLKYGLIEPVNGFSMQAEG